MTGFGLALRGTRGRHAGVTVTARILALVLAVQLVLVAAVCAIVIGNARGAIAAEVEGNDDVREVIAGLEQQYDAFMAGQGMPNLWAPDAADIPSADQLGAELEDFLRNVRDDEDDEDS